MIYMLYSDHCGFCHYYRHLIKEYNIEDKFTLINVATEIGISDNVLHSGKFTLNVPCFFTMNKEGKPKVISSLVLKEFISRLGIKLPK